MRAEEEMDGIQEQEEEFDLRERKRWLFFGLPFTFTTYRLTNKKLTMVSGLLTTVEEDIRSIVLWIPPCAVPCSRSFSGWAASGWRPPITAHPELEIHNIRNAKVFKEALDAQVEHERIRMRFRTGEYMGADMDGDGVPDMPDF